MAEQIPFDFNDPVNPKEEKRLKRLEYIKAWQRKNRKENPEAVRKKDRERYAKNKNHLREMAKLRYKNNPEPVRTQARRYQKEHPERHKETQKRRRELKKEELRSYQRSWYIANREKAIESSKQRQITKASAIRAWRREYHKNRKAADINYRLACNLRVRISKIIKGKNLSHIKELGCSIEHLRRWLEDQFLPGMTWGNYGKRGWHVDHKTPLASLDLTDPNQFKIACHYTNLQPIWWRDNISKGARIEPRQ